MTDSIAEQFEAVANAAAIGAARASTRQFALAKEQVRLAMGACSKLYTRLSFLAEMEDDAKFVAEVDRALDRERKARGFGPIPGDSVLPFPPVEGDASPPPSGGKGKARRKVIHPQRPDGS